MQFAVVDFETYFDTEYSLKRLTTEEYVRDPRFKIHCVAVVTLDGQRHIFTDNFAKNLAPFMKGFVIAQHAQFDGLILSHHLNLYPEYWGCTLSMSRAQLQFLKSHSLSALAKHYGLQEKTIDYNAFRGKRDLDDSTKNMLTNGCLNDAELTAEITLKLLDGFPPQELLIIDRTIRMFTEPVLALDSPRMAEELTRIKDKKAAALEALQVTKEQLQSTKKFAQLLIAQGIDIPIKISPRTQKEIPALAKDDEGMKALLVHDNETVAALAAARLGEKSTLMETRCERLLGMNSRGHLTVYLKYHGAHTGRWSGGDKVNFQNFPRGSELRKCIMAPKGYKLVGADSAQIECRLLNWFAEEVRVLDAFATGRDIYCENATAFFGRAITKADNDERQFGKEIELACGYGMGWRKFQMRSKQKFNKSLVEPEARRAIDIYRGSHQNVVALWNRLHKAIENMGKWLEPYNIGCVTIDGYRIIFPNGAFLDYTGLYYDGNDYRIGDGKIYGGLVTENIIQKLGLLVISNVISSMDEKYGYKLATTTHDDVLYVVPENDGEALQRLLQEMKTAPYWCKDAPLGAEGFESLRYDK